MRLSSKAIAACALLSISSMAQAEVYGGGSLAVSSLHYSDVRSGIGGTAFAGYKPTSFPMVFEVGYLNSGKNKVNDADGVGITLDGGYAALGYYGRFGRKGSGGFAKVGYFAGNSKLSEGFGFGPQKETTGGGLISLGVDLMLNPNFGFHFSVDNVIGIKDYRDFDKDHKGFMTLANAGVVFAFGGPEPDTRYGRRAAPAPVYTPAVAAPAAITPVAAPTPQASTPVVSGTQASAKGGAILRGQPSSGSSVAAVLKNGGTVVLNARPIDNAEGSWWFVSSDSGQGWIMASDLQR